MLPTPFTSQAPTRKPAAAAIAASRLPALLRAAALVSLLAQVTAGREAHADPRPIRGSSLAGKKVLAPKAGKLKKAGSKPVAGGLVKRSVTVDSSIRRGRRSEGFDWDSIRTEGYMEGDELMFMRQTVSKDIESLLPEKQASKKKTASKDRGLRAALDKAQVFHKSRVSPTLLPVDSLSLYTSEITYDYYVKTNGQRLFELGLGRRSGGFYDETFVEKSEPRVVQVRRSEEEISRELEKRFPAERFEITSRGDSYFVRAHTTIPVSTTTKQGDAYVQTTDRDAELQRNLALPDPIPAAGRVKVFRGNKKIGDHALPFDRLRARATTDRMVGDDWVNTNNLYVSPVYENDDGEGEAVLLGLAAFPLGIELHVVDLTAVKEGRANPLSLKVKASTTSGSLRVVLTGAEPGREYGIIERVEGEPILSRRTLATIRLPEPDHPLVKKHGMSYLPAKEFATPPPAQ